MSERYVVKYIKRIEIKSLEPFSLSNGIRLNIDLFYWDGEHKLEWGRSREVEKIVKNKLGQDVIDTDFVDRGYPYVEINMAMRLTFSNGKPDDCDLEDLGIILSGYSGEVSIYRSKYESSELEHVMLRSLDDNHENIESGKFYSFAGKALDLEKLKKSSADE